MSPDVRMTPIARLKAWERELRPQKLSAFASAQDRRRAEIYELWLDHGFLRRVWSNFHQIAPGVFRSNQPDRKRLEKWKARGINTVLNLRGGLSPAPMVLEREACQDLEIDLHQQPLAAREAPERENLLNLIALFRTLPRPFAMHCKSGADRASFASAIYLLTQENAPVCEARKMLSPRFIHFKWTRTGILDYILDVYEARDRAEPIPFEDWIAEEYDATTLQAGFDAKRGRK